MSKLTNVSCFTCKVQCTEIPEALQKFSKGMPLDGVQCPKCRTLYTPEGKIDGNGVRMLEEQEGVNA